MPIAVNPEHNDLAESVRSLVARVAPSDVLHEALETPISNPPPYWKSAAEQGLQGVHLSEAVGGQGFGILERATAAVWDAARAIDESRESDSAETAFEFAAAVAATLAPVAAQRCAQDC